jgi:hypothetical protein
MAQTTNLSMKHKLLNGQHLSLNDQIKLLSEFVLTIDGIPQILAEICKLPNAWPWGRNNISERMEHHAWLRN